MISALLLTISTVALIHFGVYYWRALMLGVATSAVSDQIASAAGADSKELVGSDFDAVVGLNRLCPDLQPMSSGVSFVRLYHIGLKALNSVSQTLCPTVASWARCEMAFCSRYVAVRIEQRVARNDFCMAELRSF